MKKKMVELTALSMSAVLLAGCEFTTIPGEALKAAKENAKKEEAAEIDKKELVDIPLVDDSFSDCTESNVSNDLVRWLLATTAVEVQGQGLDWQQIGGTQSTAEDIETVKKYLDENNAKDGDAALEAASALVEEDYTKAYERAYNLGTAESILAASYCAGDLEFNQYLMHAVPVAKMIQQEFDSFDDYGDNYVTGYMCHVGQGDCGDASRVGYRVVLQQAFVGMAAYYDGAYAIDYDMELTGEAYSTYFDEMPEEVDTKSLEGKAPEFVQGYIAPIELGENPASGNIEIDGDLYHVPFTIKQLTDNGWEIKDAPSELDVNRDDTIKLTRNRKTIKVTTEAISEGYTDVQYGFVDYIDTATLGDVEVSLPGDIKSGMDMEDAKDVIDKFEIENDEMTDSILLYISDDSDNKSKICITEEDGKVSSFVLFVSVLNGQQNMDQYYTTLKEDGSNYSYAQAMTIKAKTDKYRPGAEYTGLPELALSDSLDDFTIQIDNTVIQLPTTYQQLLELGFIFDDSADTVVQPDEQYEFSGYYLGNEYSKMNFIVINNGEEEAKLGDIPVQYVRATIFGFNEYQDYPFKIAQGVEFEATLEDLQEKYGTLTKSDNSFDNGYVQLDYYTYETEKGWYTFWVQPEGMYSGVEINVYTNKKAEE
ncbi:Protein of unknown function [Pseudobutyrivibrio sp. C4]|uniref:DUF1266 domain-containing protein n=1 Tax=Pseudobutyrivibrio sp. C4 TaxID=1520803 RepID=UPI0008C278BB|nr:DUF1266 domain-containing protein [Pseudobutyrivibrio sp. C4]SET14565.1 Protein of unknown function [Pseudobutyrivibrio sp. C4]